MAFNYFSQESLFICFAEKKKHEQGASIVFSNHETILLDLDL